jgi:HAD superfamily hydrolase (TIGR01509 family)
VIPFNAVIFDMDGLLLDTESIALDAFNETCADCDIEQQRELFLRLIGTNQGLGERLLMEGLPRGIDYKMFSGRWYENYIKRIRDAPLPLKSGALDLLRFLESRRIPRAVATSSKTERAVEKLQSADIFHWFKIVVGGDRVEHSKPNPDIYLKAAELMGMRPEACLALEDSENGVRSAVAAGMAVIQVPDMVPPSISLKALGHTVLDSLKDVLDYLSALEMSA